MIEITVGRTELEVDDICRVSGVGLVNRVIQLRAMFGVNTKEAGM
jgi:hypothetical protein